MRFCSFSNVYYNILLFPHVFIIKQFEVYDRIKTIDFSQMFTGFEALSPILSIGTVETNFLFMF